MNHEAPPADEPTVITGREFVERFPALSRTLAAIGQAAVGGGLRPGDDSQRNAVADTMADTEPTAEAE